MLLLAVARVVSSRTICVMISVTAIQGKKSRYRAINKSSHDFSPLLIGGERVGALEGKEVSEPSDEPERSLFTLYRVKLRNPASTSKPT
jgi:hypothetical protein